MFIISDECNNSLGMESGKIPDMDITSSSSFDYGTGPHKGRLVIIIFNYFQRILLFKKTTKYSSIIMFTVPPH